MITETVPAGARMTCNNDVNTVRGLIDRMAGIQPDRAFLISPETGRVLTFKGLHEQAHHLYGRFRQMGLQHGDKIAFLMDNGLFTAQLFLGAMYGGFVSVPLNVRAGVSQLSYTLDHCDAKVVFVASQYSALIKEVMADVSRPVAIIPADLDSCLEVSETPSITGHIASGQGGGCGSANVQFRHHRATEGSSPYSQIRSCAWKEFRSFTPTHRCGSVSACSSTISHKCRVCDPASYADERRFSRHTARVCCQRVLELVG